MSMPTIAASLETMDMNGGIQNSPFPAPNKQAAGLVKGTQTDVSSVYFSDKILVTISQGGRLSQWVQVPLLPSSPTAFDTALPADNSDLLPLDHLTPKTLLGAGGDRRETAGHLYASQIASTLVKRNPEETRTLMVGLGLLNLEMDSEAFFDLLELVQKVL